MSPWAPLALTTVTAALLALPVTPALYEFGNVPMPRPCLLPGMTVGSRTLPKRSVRACSLSFQNWSDAASSAN